MQFVLSFLLALFVVLPAAALDESCRERYELKPDAHKNWQFNLWRRYEMAAITKLDPQLAAAFEIVSADDATLTTFARTNNLQLQVAGVNYLLSHQLPEYQQVGQHALRHIVEPIYEAYQLFITGNNNAITASHNIEDNILTWFKTATRYGAQPQEVSGLFSPELKQKFLEFEVFANHKKQGRHMEELLEFYEENYKLCALGRTEQQIDSAVIQALRSHITSTNGEITLAMDGFVTLVWGNNGEYFQLTNLIHHP